MRAREFITEYDRKKTAQAISGSERAERAIIADRGDMGPFGRVRGILIGLQLGSRPITIPGAQPAFTPPADYKTKPDEPLIKDPATREQFLEDLLKVIETKDPTQNKQYTPWLARMYINGGVRLEDLNRHNILGIYDIGKRRRMIKPEDADINRFKTYRDFETTMRDNYDLDQIDNTEKKEDDKGRAKTVYDDAEVRVVVPEDEAAACYYGRGTRWCTAATKGKNYFDHYNKDGPMYILIPKTPAYAGEKYQLHFPSQQFMDPKDEEVSLFYLLDMRFPELKQFFLKNEPELQDYIIFASDEVLQPLIDQIAEIAQDKVWGVVSDWEMSDEYYYQEMQEKYADEEGDIDWDRVHEAGDDYTKWNDEARRFSIDMNHAIKPTAKRLKKWAVSAAGPGPAAVIQDLPEVIAGMIRDEFPSKREADGGIPDFLWRKIVVRKDGDGWRASLAKIG